MRLIKIAEKKNKYKMEASQGYGPEILQQLRFGQMRLKDIKKILER